MALAEPTAQSPMSTTGTDSHDHCQRNRDRLTFGGPGTRLRHGRGVDALGRCRQGRQRRCRPRGQPRSHDIGRARRVADHGRHPGRLAERQRPARRIGDRLGGTRGLGRRAFVGGPAGSAVGAVGGAIGGSALGRTIGGWFN